MQRHTPQRIQHMPMVHTPVLLQLEMFSCVPLVLHLQPRAFISVVSYPFDPWVTQHPQSI